jgi:mediator of RNA polymerase II transcription subunit 31
MSTTPLRTESEEQLKLRFQVELEFVQCLANPNYLNFLAQREYLKEPSFINYLAYLRYWKEPAYARFLKYPMALTFLDLLQAPTFRAQLANNKCAKFIEDQQLLHWQHYIRKRVKLVGSGQGGQSAGQRTSSTGDQGGQATNNEGGGGGGGSNSTTIANNMNSSAGSSLGNSNK